MISHHCECGNAKHWNAHACSRCANLEREGNAETETPEHLLVTLQHFDWLAVDDLYDALELGESERNKYSSALSRLIKLGQVERRKVPACWGRYRGTISQVRLVQRKRRCA